MGKWLKFLGHPRYAAEFMRQKVNGSNLLNMTDDVLEDMHVSSSDCEHILTAIQDLDANQQRALTIRSANDDDSDEEEPQPRARKDSTGKESAGKGSAKDAKAAASIKQDTRSTSHNSSQNTSSTLKDVQTLQAVLKSQIASTLPDKIRVPIYADGAIPTLIYKTMIVSKASNAANLRLICDII